MFATNNHPWICYLHLFLMCFFIIIIYFIEFCVENQLVFSAIYPNVAETLMMTTRHFYLFFYNYKDKARCAH